MLTPVTSAMEYISACLIPSAQQWSLASRANIFEVQILMVLLQIAVKICMKYSQLTGETAFDIKNVLPFERVYILPRGAI